MGDTTLDLTNATDVLRFIDLVLAKIEMIERMHEQVPFLEATADDRRFYAALAAVDDYRRDL